MVHLKISLGPIQINYLILKPQPARPKIKGKPTSATIRNQQVAHATTRNTPSQQDISIRIGRKHKGTRLEGQPIGINKTTNKVPHQGNNKAATSIIITPQRTNNDTSKTTSAQKQSMPATNPTQSA
jgi:hypothetical protein